MSKKVEKFLSPGRVRRKRGIARKVFVHGSKLGGCVRSVEY
jgi:hypothetical protein